MLLLRNIDMSEIEDLEEQLAKSFEAIHNLIFSPMRLDPEFLKELIEDSIQPDIIVQR